MLLHLYLSQWVWIAAGCHRMSSCCSACCHGHDAKVDLALPSQHRVFQGMQCVKMTQLHTVSMQTSCLHALQCRSPGTGTGRHKSCMQPATENSTSSILLLKYYSAPRHGGNQHCCSIQMHMYSSTVIDITMIIVIYRCPAHAR